MAVAFADLNLTNKGLDVEYEEKIDKILADPEQVSSRMRVIGGNYSISFLVNKPIDPGSFLALRAKYVAAGWDDLVMNTSENISLLKAIS
jgi:hypothetical protein